MEKEVQKLDLMPLIGDFFKIARRYLILGIALAVLAGGFFGLRHYRGYVPEYTAAASFSVRVANPVYGSIAAYNTATAEQMAKTFPYVLTSGVLQERICNHLGITKLPRISVTTSTSGSIITIQVTDTDPELAWQVLQAVMVYYPEIAEYVVGPTVLVLLQDSGIPTTPINTMQVKNAVIKGAVLGCALWVLFVLVLALMVNTVHDEKELKNLLNVPCIGQIPYVRRSARKGGSMLYPQIRSTKYQEAVRLLRLRVERTLENQGKKVLLVSSALPGEGKTTVSVNLALSLAGKGKKVLLVDCDLRNPSVAKSLAVQDLPVIGQYLAGQLEMNQVVSKTPHKNLYLVSGGTKGSSDMKILRMSRLAELIRAARKTFDIVILDTPPCSLLADASEFAAMADCGLMVVRQEFASREQILDGVQRLNDAHLPMIGCAMNHVQATAANGYGYGYGYGYGEKK
jgi:receptor protein-tyrosine kinase